MEIGIVLSTTPGYSETFFLSKIKGLQDSGYAITLYTQKANPDFTLCKVVVSPKVHKNNTILQFVKMNFIVLVFALSYPKRFFKFLKLERQIKRSWLRIAKNMYNNVHLLQSHMDWLHFGFATMALQSEHVAQTIDAKMAVSFRGYDIDIYPLKFAGCYNNVWKNVDKIHSISNYLLNKAYTLGLSKSTAYQIITPAINTSKFIKEGTLSKNKTTQILTIARLEWIKGLNYTLEALAILKEQGILFHYTIIGNGKVKEELLFSIYQLGLRKEVTLLSEIPHENVMNYLSKSTLYLQYSISEGFCNAVLEAQAMGCLCIVSDGGALPENVLHKETGWVVQKRNSKLLADKIIKTIQLPNSIKEKISTNAQEHVKKHYNLYKQQQRFNEFYKLD